MLCGCFHKAGSSGFLKKRRRVRAYVFREMKSLRQTCRSPSQTVLPHAFYTL
ncbi:hypothetical protein CHCC20335_0972 [Bacillus paralicheniformis]|nr:hypothetical protein CHCC20335_0972 [Bacillus paralicheniformis]